MLRHLFVIAVLALQADVAAAQVAVSAGASVPREPESITDVYRAGYSVALAFVLESGNAPWARLRPFASYAKFRTRPGPFRDQFQEGFGVDLQLEGGNRSIIFVGADLQIRRPFANFTPYVAPLGGLVVFSTDELRADGIPIDFEDNRAGLALGLAAGVAYVLSRQYEVFFDVAYVHARLEGSDLAFVPVRLGMEFSFDY